MARFSEVHGMPTRVGMVPAVGDPGDRAAFETSIASLGSDAAMILPQGVDGPDGSGYDYKLVEAVDTAWESFGAMISRCDTSIVLSILFQNLTTEVQDGSFSATNAHMDIREGGIQDDDASWTCTAFQISRAFAYLNFGDADLAPTTYRDVKPREDLDANSKRFQAFATAIGSLTTAGYKFTSPEEVKVFAREQFGLNLPSFVIGEVIQKGAVPPVEAEEPERPEKPSKAKVKKAA
jgi:phage gp29-like protein